MESRDFKSAEKAWNSDYFWSTEYQSNWRNTRLNEIYVLACQVHVKAGATLSIQAGVTIYATPEGEAPRLPARTRLG